MAEKIEVPVEIGGPQAVAQVQRLKTAVDGLEESVDKLSDKAGDARESLSDLGQRSSVSLRGLGEAFTSTTTAVAAFAAATVAAGVALGTAAGHGEDNLRAVNALGDAYRAVSDATGDTVTATQAYATQQRLVRSGLQVSTAQLATITRAARDYARATGTDATQATEQLADALVGASADELEKYGVSLQSGLDRTTALARATEQLAEQQRGLAPAARSMGEDMTRLGTASTEAASAFAMMAANGLGLQGVVSGIASRLRQLTADIQDAINASRQARATEADVAARQQALDERRALTREMQARLRASGVAEEQIRGVAPTAEVLMRTSPEALAAQNARLRAALESTAAATPATGETITAAFMRQQGDVRAGRVSGIESLTQEQLRAQFSGDRITGTGSFRARSSRATSFERAVQQQTAQQAAQSLLTTAGDLTQELLRGVNQGATDAVIQITASRSGGGGGGGGGGARTDLTAAAMEAAHREAQRLRGSGAAPTMSTMFDLAAQDQAAVRAREASERQAAIGRQSNAITDALAAQERAGQALADAQAGQFRPGGVQGNDERLAMLREQSQAMQAMLTQTDAAIAAARERGASESELNGLLSQRAGLVSANSAAEREAAALERERIAGLTSYRDAMVSNLGSVAEAFGAATEAAINGEQSFGKALQGQLRAVLVALAKQSVVEGLKNLALGFSALATPGTQLSAAGYFKAAGLWAATGVAAGAGAAAIPQASAPAAGASAARPPSAARAREGGAGGETQQPLTLNIMVSGALFNEGVEEGVVRALDRAATRGLSPRVLRMGRGMA
jgi:hypothetical protein